MIEIFNRKMISAANLRKRKEKEKENEACWQYVCMYKLFLSMNDQKRNRESLVIEIFDRKIITAANLVC